MQKFRPITLRFVLFIALFVSWNILPACGGPSFDNPGVDKNKQLKDLSADEVQTLKTLADTIIYTEERRKQFCQFMGIFMTSFMGGTENADKAKLEQKCLEIEQKCQKDDSDKKEILGKKQTECSVTVGEWAACMKAREVEFDKIMKALSKYSCSNLLKTGDKLTDEDGNEINTQKTLPECKNFKEKCE